MSALHQWSAGGRGASDELSVEELAARLGLPVSMLVRRIEAGMLPARRLETPDGVAYRVAVATLQAIAPPPAEAEDEPGVPQAEVAGTPYPSERAPAPAVGSAAPTAVTPASAALSVTIDDADEPGTELGALGIDARQLVAALLERWERAYEQRIHAEFRLRYEGALGDHRERLRRLEAELSRAGADLAVRTADHATMIADHRAALAERDAAVRDVEARLETVRAELTRVDAARDLAAAERSRLTADLERERRDREQHITTRDRILDELRRQVGERDRLVADLRARLDAADGDAAKVRRRGLFRR